MTSAGPMKSPLSDPYDIGWVPVDTSGYTEDEAYAFLTANASGVFTAAAWNENEHPRNADGKFTRMFEGDISDAVAEFSSRFKKAKSGRSARKSAMSAKDFKKDPVKWEAARHYEMNSDNLNNGLRSGEGTFDYTNAARTNVPPLDEMMEQSRLTRDVKVLRGIGDPRRVFGSQTWDEDGDNSGLEWKDRAFVSTTTASSIANWFTKLRKTSPGAIDTKPAAPVIMNVLVPKGVNALEMNTGIRDGKEKELLLDRDLSFRIVNDHGVGEDGLRRMDVEVIPKDDYGLLTAAADDLEDDDEDDPVDVEEDWDYFIDDGPEVDVLTAAAEVHTGAMIALVPSQADLERLAVVTGEPADQLHLTLAYLGEADAIPEEMRAKIIMSTARYFSTPVTTEAFYSTAFNPHNPEMDTALVLGIKGEDIVGPRTNVVSAVRGMYEMPAQHEPWIPHVTLAYDDDLSKVEEFCDRLGPITFDTLRYAFGGEVTDFPLAVPLTAAVSRMPRALKKYWLGPEGSARVGGWGNPGSYTACQAAMREEGVDAREIDGLCANLYRAATGKNPGRKKEHAVETVTAAVVVNEIDDVVEIQPEQATLAAWDGILTLEGKESGDGRLFQPGSLDWAQLPLPLMYQPANSGGHSDSIMVGQINDVMRDGSVIRGRGIIDLEAKTATGFAIGREVFRLLDEGYLKGVSVDVDKVKDADVELVYATLPGESPAPFEKPTMTVFHRGRIRGATIVAFPAFVEANIQLSGRTLTASFIGEVLTMDNCGCGGEQVLTAASHTITIPDVPPAHWFNEPTDVEVKGALTITDEGRVFGRLAPSNTTHRSVNRRVPTNVDYSRFMGAETIVANTDGSTGRVVTGPVTFNCGHASEDPTIYGTLANRKRHYDNSCSIFADISIGEDKAGNVWVAGAVKPYASGEQIQQAMSCRLSGDWQPHPDRPGVTEFIAALLVPVPGFAMARKEASVLMEDGVMVASAIPVEFAETEKADESLLTAATQKKHIFAQRLGLDAKSLKMELAKRIGEAGNDV